MGQCAVSLPTDLMGHQGLPKILRGSKKPLLGLPSTVGQAPSNGSRATQQIPAWTLPAWHPIRWV